ATRRETRRCSSAHRALWTVLLLPGGGPRPGYPWAVTVTCLLAGIFTNTDQRGFHRTRRSASGFAARAEGSAESPPDRGRGHSGAGTGMPPRCAHPASGVQHHLGVALDALVELAVRLRGLAQGELVGDHEAGLGPAGDDHVPQLAVVALDVALPGAHDLALFEHPPDGH